MQKVKEDSHSQPETDHLKKMFARQRAKDLSEHAKAMLTKDREIEDLRKKCQELADQLSNAEFLGPEVCLDHGCCGWSHGWHVNDLLKYKMT